MVERSTEGPEPSHQAIDTVVAPRTIPVTPEKHTDPVGCGEGKVNDQRRDPLTMTAPSFSFRLLPKTY